MMPYKASIYKQTREDVMVSMVSQQDAKRELQRFRLRLARKRGNFRFYSMAIHKHTVGEACFEGSEIRYILYYKQ
jgi:hypothetical protein